LYGTVLSPSASIERDQVGPGQHSVKKFTGSGTGRALMQLMEAPLVCRAPTMVGTPSPTTR
jgi:hypothetical protein